MITSISQVVIGVGGADSSLSGSSSLKTISLSAPSSMMLNKNKIMSNFFFLFFSFSSEYHELVE